MLLKPSDPAFRPRYVDMLFMSTSALMVSGLAAVEMENLSSAQIVVLTLLMFHGGKVFVTLLGLLLGRGKQDEAGSSAGRVDSACIELESFDPSQNTIDRIESGISPAAAVCDERSVRSPGYVVSGYVANFHLLGTSLLLACFAGVSRERLSYLVIVLLLMIAQVLGGNTLFPLFLRWVIRALKKLTGRDEFKCMLKSTVGAQLSPLLHKSQTLMLMDFLVQFEEILSAIRVDDCTTCARRSGVDWNGAMFDGLTSVEKLVSALFVAVNSRRW
ncbi:unnamed protein product [Musa textilis]